MKIFGFYVLLFAACHTSVNDKLVIGLLHNSLDVTSGCFGMQIQADNLHC